MALRDDTNPNVLFTSILDLMSWLYFEADDRGAGWVRRDVLFAINELELGPWSRVTSAPVVVLPFTVMCVRLDVLLRELGRLSPGLRARVALARAQRVLNGGTLC